MQVIDHASHLSFMIQTERWAVPSGEWTLFCYYLYIQRAPFDVGQNAMRACGIALLVYR